MALGRNHKIFNIGNASGTIQGLTRVYHDLTLSGDGTLSSLLGHHATRSVPCKYWPC